MQVVYTLLPWVGEWRMVVPLKTRWLYLSTALILAPIATTFDPPSAQAQVLNTRPLSQPYVNPTNPNAGAPLGSYVNRGSQGVSEQELERMRRRSAEQKRGCWRDSIGQTRCAPAR